MENSFSNYIITEVAILIPALYALGMFFKASKIRNEFIPFILLCLGIIGAVLLNGINIDSFIQGILVSAVAVFSNQIIKQTGKLSGS